MSTIAPAAPTGLADLGPVAQLRAGRLARRLPQLYVGLVFYGISIGFLVRSGYGLAPWSVFESGLIRHVPLTLGQAVILVSFALLLLWIPLRETPGLGTVSNAVIIGLAVDATTHVVPAPDPVLLRIVLMVGGVALCGLATAMYIGAQFGRGPRDGLMTGLARRTGWSVRLSRTLIEVTVLAAGWLLGGSVGVGTVVYAVAIGPLVHILLPRFIVQAAAQKTTNESAPATC